MEPTSLGSVLFDRRTRPGLETDLLGSHPLVSACTIPFPPRSIREQGISIG
jgi:hypothetical protein